MTSLGEIGHIYSGSPEGPRYSKSLTIDQLKSPQNGILLCRHHHRLVDRLDSEYAVEDLIRMKHHHEFQVSSDIGVLTYPSLWIDSMILKEFQLFVANSVIYFGRVNHIYGNHGLGKTAILQVLASALTSVPNTRWADFRISLQIRMSTMAGTSTAVDVLMENNMINYQVDGHHVPLFPEAFFVVFLKKALKPHADDIEAIRRCYDLPLGFLERLIVSSNLKGITTSRYSLKTTREIPYLSRDLLVDTGSEYVQKFDTCSGSEQGRVILDLGIASASAICHYRPVIFLIDWINIAAFGY